MILKRYKGMKDNNKDLTCKRYNLVFSAELVEMYEYSIFVEHQTVNCVCIEHWPVDVEVSQFSVSLSLSDKGQIDKQHATGHISFKVNEKVRRFTSFTFFHR